MAIKIMDALDNVPKLDKQVFTIVYCVSVILAFFNLNVDLGTWIGWIILLAICILFFVGSFINLAFLRSMISEALGDGK